VPAGQRFLARNLSPDAQKSKFPVKFPDSREIVRRRVRSALRRQPVSPADGGATPQGAEKRAFTNGANLLTEVSVGMTSQQIRSQTTVAFWSFHHTYVLANQVFVFKQRK
jgi:hypothetical protein